MGRGIIQLFSLIIPAADDAVFLNDYCTNRYFPCFKRSFRLSKGLFHPANMVAWQIELFLKKKILERLNLCSHIFSALQRSIRYYRI